MDSKGMRSLGAVESGSAKFRAMNPESSKRLI